MAKPARSRLAEILESGRCPGFRVAGGTPRGPERKLSSPMFDYRGRPITPQEREREDRESMREAYDQVRAAKLRKGVAKRPVMQQVGRINLQKYRDLEKQVGRENFRGDEKKRILREAGCIWDD